MTNVAAGHDAAIPSARLLGTAAQHGRPALRTTSEQCDPRGPHPVLTGGIACELAHAVTSHQDFTACADPGAIALRAVSVHCGHHWKRCTESGTRTGAEEHHERAGKQFPRATGYRTRIRADLSFGARSPESRQAPRTGGGHRAGDRS